MASTARTHDNLLAVARAMMASSEVTRKRRLRHARTPNATAPVETGEHRYERKYRIDSVPLSAVEWWLRRHPALFRPLHRVRWINNIYYDTQDLRAVWENLNGDSKRTKTRIRWYGELLGRIEAAVLERKMRDGLVGGKQIFVLPPFTMDEVPDLNVVREAIAEADLPDLVRLDVSLMRPVLVNRYRRRYYQSADGRYRATVDSDLEFYPAPGPTALMMRRFPMQGTLVLELKYRPNDETQASSIGEFLPVRSTRNSKYITGMQMCYPIPDVQQ